MEMGETYWTHGQADSSTDITSPADIQVPRQESSQIRSSGDRVSRDIRS
jgi:hypothetical protein